MKATLITVGPAKDPFRDDQAHYLKLLRRHLDLQLVEVRGPDRIAEKIPDRCRLVALDEGGKARDSQGWADWLAQRRLEAIDICFLIGGQTGLPRELLESAAERVSFGPQTLAHQLARIVLLEQLFRAAKIAAGERYHC